MNVHDYLERFKASHLYTVSLDDLTELQKLHMYEIPFENLDVIRRTPIYLNIELIYKKIVDQRRGGYCYELNGLFHWLLQQLGYDANLAAATVYRPNGHFAKSETHAALIVRLGRPYLVDVGFGDSTVKPIPLCGEQITDPSGTYYVQLINEEEYALHRIRHGEIQKLYKFSTAKRNLVDFHEGCVFNQVSPDSTFTHVDIVTKATSTGRITIRDRDLAIIENGVKTTRTLSTVEKTRYLMEEFGLNL